MALSRTVIVSSTAYSIVGISYFYFILGNSWTTRFSYGASRGLLGYEVSGNTLCVLVIFSILLTLSLFKKGALRQNVSLVFCLIPQIAVVLLVQSRGAYIALILSLIVVLWRYKNILLAVLILLFIIAASSPIKNRATVEDLLKDPRIKVWLTTLEVVKDYPVVGIGFGNETYGKKLDLMMYNNRQPQEYRQMKGYIVGAPHNIFLNILVRTGFLGLALFLFIIGVFFWMCWRCAQSGKDDFVRKWGRCIGSAFFAFLIVGMFDQMFHHFTELVLYTILSMGTIIWRLNKEPSTQSFLA